MDKFSKKLHENNYDKSLEKSTSNLRESRSGTPIRMRSKKEIDFGLSLGRFEAGTNPWRPRIDIPEESIVRNLINSKTKGAGKVNGKFRNRSLDSIDKAKKVI